MKLEWTTHTRMIGVAREIARAAMTLSPFKSQDDPKKTTFIQVNRLLAKFQGKPRSLHFVEYEGCWESHKSAFSALYLVPALFGNYWALFGSAS